MFFFPQHSVLRACLLMSACLAIHTSAAAQVSGLSVFQRYRAMDPTVERATSAMAARRFDEAQRILQPCLRSIPDHFEAHYMLAQMAYEKHDYAGALAHLETTERSLAELDTLYRGEVADLKTQADDEERDMRTSLGELYARGGDPTGCSALLFIHKQQDLDYLEKKKGHLSDSDNPFGIPADYRFLHGNCLYRLGRKTDALAQYRLAVGTDPGHANAWNNLISLCLEARDYSQAREALAQAEAIHIVIQPGLKQAILDSPGQGEARPTKKE